MISAVILTKNSEKTITKTLNSLKKFNEVIIVDNGSIDKTIEISEKFSNVKIIHEKFIGFGPLRNLGTQFAKNDWILAIDSDEILSKELIDEMKKEVLDENLVYFFPFKNFYNEKHIKWCGWYPDFHPRLYSKNMTKFCDSKIHEKVIIKNLKIKYFKNSIHHYSYTSIDDFLDKMKIYSNLFANQNKKVLKSSYKKAIFHSFFAFFKSYFLKRGFLGGFEGFLISYYNANVAFYKYLKLLEEIKKCS